MPRAGFYIDGFNFYHAVADQNQPHLKWMCYRALAEELKLRTETVEFVKIFTAYATHLPPSMVRHRVAVKAWQCRGCEVVLGEFKRKFTFCKTCRTTTKAHEEKESDVNIALHLLEDCRNGRMDVAYILTGDSDISPAFKMAMKVYPHIDLVTVPPPGRIVCKAIKSLGPRTASVNWGQVHKCLMPKEIVDATGKVVATRPPEYDPPV